MLDFQVNLLKISHSNRLKHHELTKIEEKSLLFHLYKSLSLFHLQPISTPNQPPIPPTTNHSMPVRLPVAHPPGGTAARRAAWGWRRPIPRAEWPGTTANCPRPCTANHNLKDIRMEDRCVLNVCFMAGGWNIWILYMEYMDIYNQGYGWRTGVFLNVFFKCEFPKDMAGGRQVF